MTMFTRNDKVSDLDVEHKVHESGSARFSAPTQEVPGRQVRAAKGESGQHTAPSIISKSLKITGQLESSEDIQIDGEVEGDIRGLSVKVGSGATVTGSVYGEVVELSGTVNGKIEARQVVLTGADGCRAMSSIRTSKSTRARISTARAVLNSVMPKKRKCTRSMPPHRPAKKIL